MIGTQVWWTKRAYVGTETDPTTRTAKPKYDSVDYHGNIAEWLVVPDEQFDIPPRTSYHVMAVVMVSDGGFQLVAIGDLSHKE